MAGSEGFEPSPDNHLLIVFKTILFNRLSNCPNKWFFYLDSNKEPVDYKSNALTS